MGGGEVLKKGSLIKSPPLDGGALKVLNIAGRRLFRASDFIQ